MNNPLSDLDCYNSSLFLFQVSFDKFSFVPDLRTGALAGGVIQTALGPINFLFRVSIPFTMKSICFIFSGIIAFLYLVNCLVAGLLLLFGVFLNEQSHIFKQIVFSVMGTVLLFAEIVILPIIETVLEGDEYWWKKNYATGLSIVAILQFLVCFVPQVYLILCSVDFNRKLKAGEVKAND